MSGDSSAQLIMDLRRKTGAGISDCKKALAESGGNVEEALVHLRKKGLADAAKRSGRATSEGAVSYAGSGSAAALVELNCETDFVARTEEFQALARKAAEAAAQGSLKAEGDLPGLEALRAKLGENLRLRRFERFSLSGPGHLAGYVHLDLKKGAMVELTLDGAAGALSPAQKEALEALGKELLLQIVGSGARYLSRDEVPQADVAREREIFAEQLKSEGKPDAAIAKIVEGKLQKLFYQASCLLEQNSLRDNKTPIRRLVEEASAKAGARVAVARFVRYVLGE